MIEIKNLTKRFGDNLVWQDVSLNIEEGEILAIIGKSGCGKSVLLKHINALMTPTSGEILINKRNIFTLSYAELRKMRQLFGVLFQGAALFDSISAFENVAFPLRFFTEKTEAEIRDRVEECLLQVNLENIGDKSTAELSGGMRKRVGLARAIVLEPEYLMYDEPTSGLDPQTSDEINDLILKTADELGVTSIVITHDMHSVLRVSDKVAFLEQQSLFWYGTRQEMLDTEDETFLQFITASEYKIKA